MMEVHGLDVMNDNGERFVNACIPDKRKRMLLTHDALVFWKEAQRALIGWEARGPRCITVSFRIKNKKIIWSTVNKRSKARQSTITPPCSSLIGLVGISIIIYTGSDLTYHDVVFIKVTLIVER